MYKYSLSLSYAGNYFFGSQSQPENLTVSSYLSKYLNPYFHSISPLVFSGRTDKHVHANQQNVHFTSSVCPNLDSIVRSINSSQKYIYVNSIQRVPPFFHSRRSPITREYTYLFTSYKLPLFLQKNCSQVKFEPKIQCVNLILSYIQGKFDFHVFQKANRHNDQRSTIRTIYKANCSYQLLTSMCEINKPIKIYKITIVGNAFLYQMIRNIIGALLTVLSPSNNLSHVDFKELLVENKRVFNFRPAPPEGLYLNKIIY